MKNPARKIVVSGLGLVSPLGSTLEQFESALWEGKSGIHPFHFAREGDSPIPYAASCLDFTGKIEDFEECDASKKKAIKKATKLMSREIQMAVAAAQKSLADSALELQSLPKNKIGVSFGCELIYSSVEDLLDGFKSCLSRDKGDMQFDFSLWAELGLPKLTPIWQLKYLPNMPSSHIAIINELFGPNNSIILREASIGAVVNEAAEMIRSGRVEVMIVGATGSKIHPIKMLQTLVQEQVADLTGCAEPATLSKPFDRSRKGMLLGEGAGALVLESREHAERRNAPIYAEIESSCGLANPKRSPYSKKSPQFHEGDSREKALIHAMKNVLGIGKEEPHEEGNPDSVGHINAHGLSSVSADIAESRAIESVFANRAEPIPTTTLKGHLGNLGAGSGAIELIAGILSLRRNRIFPTLNHRETDPHCSLRIVREGECVPAGNSFLKLSFNPQGQSSAVYVKKV